jgi:peptide/nickel transport system ATP-binding protein
VSVRRLTASYSGKRILEDVSLDVPAGECIGIVGESGSGKTTLARCLVGLHRECDADMSVLGERIPTEWRRRSANDRRRIQYVFQNPYASLNPRLTVSANVEEPLRVFTSMKASQRRQAALAALDRVSLGAEFADRMPDNLSGGERQRVAVARARIVEPEVLICDEITSALDVSVQALVIEQLRAMQQSGLTMLFITHNLAVVRSIAQRVIVLERGRVVESGRVGDVLDAPRHPYTQQLLKDLPGY